MRLKDKINGNFIYYRICYRSTFVAHLRCTFDESSKIYDNLENYGKLNIVESVLLPWQRRLPCPILRRRSKLVYPVKRHSAYSLVCSESLSLLEACRAQEIRISYFYRIENLSPKMRN